MPVQQITWGGKQIGLGKRSPQTSKNSMLLTILHCLNRLIRSPKCKKYLVYPILFLVSQISLTRKRKGKNTFLSVIGIVSKHSLQH